VLGSSRSRPKKKQQRPRNVFFIKELRERQHTHEGYKVTGIELLIHDVKSSSGDRQSQERRNQGDACVA
jgi:hypothetical protein